MSDKESEIALSDQPSGTGRPSGRPSLEQPASAFGLLVMKVAFLCSPFGTSLRGSEATEAIPNLSRVSKSVISTFILLVLFSIPAFAEKPLLSTSLPIPSEIPHSIKVALMVDVPSVSIYIEGPYMVKISETAASVFESKPLQATVLADEQGIKMNDQLYPTDRMTLTVPSGSIQVGRKRYARQIQIIKKSGNKLLVVNQIDLEEYLKGVLPLEVHPDWSAEFLKAHAVISRTFALFKTLEKKDLDYALVDTAQSQVYGGSLFHKESTDHAVDLTRGEVLTSDGKLFPSYFHAACGGRTAQADQIWPVEPNPVLKGVVCNFCKGTKYWRWSLKMPLQKIEEIMHEKDYPAKNLSNIQFTARDRSGRATRVILKYKLSIVVIRADDFRAWIGYDLFKSLKAGVTVENGLASFVGYGWGHGIGFCQWGAKAQAEAGKNYREILSFYFPGSELKKF